MVLVATPGRLRSAERRLLAAAGSELAGLWRQVSNAVEAEQALRDVLPFLVRDYGQAAAAVAADWYEEARSVAAVRGSFTAVPASLGDQGVDSLARWAAGRGVTVESIRSLAVGGMERRIMQWSRDTVMGAALADPAADGWQRAGVGSCAFCAMLIGRGAVYSEATADFSAHDACNCSAVPAFRGRPRPVSPFKPSERAHSDADRARVREWLRTH